MGKDMSTEREGEPRFPQDYPELKLSSVTKPIYNIAKLAEHYDENKKTQDIAECVADTAMEMTANATKLGVAYNIVRTYKKCRTDGEGATTCAVATSTKVLAEVGTFVAGSAMITASVPTGSPVLGMTGISACHQSSKAGELAQKGTIQLMHTIYDIFDIVSSYFQSDQIVIDTSKPCLITDPEMGSVTLYLSQQELGLLHSISNFKQLSHTTSKIVGKKSMIGDSIDKLKGEIDGIKWQIDRDTKTISVTVNDHAKVFNQLQSDYTNLKEFSRKTKAQLVVEEQRRQEQIRVAQERYRMAQEQEMIERERQRTRQSSAVYQHCDNPYGFHGSFSGGNGGGGGMGFVVLISFTIPLSGCIIC